MTQVDVLITPMTRAKSRQLLHAVHAGAVEAGLDSRIVQDGKTRKGALVVLYGLGGSDRVEYAGRPNVISFDAGYWERKIELEQRKYRVSIGGFHCPDRIFQGPNPGPERWESSGLSIAESGGDPNGPILLVGNGPKSNRIGAADWCADMSRNLRQWFPGKTIWYRPKPKRAHDQCVDYDALAEKINLDSVLAQCSLVVCRHSNVAVDCARTATPCACEDGAAKSIYWAPRRSVLQPTYEIRRDFLYRLAWWQWSIVEIRAGMFWPWMLEQVKSEN